MCIGRHFESVWDSPRFWTVQTSMRTVLTLYFVYYVSWHCTASVDVLLVWWINFVRGRRVAIISAALPDCLSHSHLVGYWFLVCGYADTLSQLWCHCTAPVFGLLRGWINFDSGGCVAGGQWRAWCICVYCSRSGEDGTESGRAIYNCTARVSVTGMSTAQSNPWRLLC